MTFHQMIADALKPTTTYMPEILTQNRNNLLFLVPRRQKINHIKYSNNN